MKLLLRWCCLLTAMAAVQAGAAERIAYPQKPIRIIIAQTTGTSVDTLSRVLALRLGEALGQQVVADNRGGAGGIIGTEMVARSAPDGYTLLMGSMTTHAINPAFHPNLSYDAVKSFQPVSRIIAAPQLLVVHPSVAATSVKELVALAKEIGRAHV